MLSPIKKKSDRLQKLLSNKLNYPCKVYFRRKSPSGWFFETKKTYPQRLAGNYKFAINFIANNKLWNLLKEDFKEENNE